MLYISFVDAASAALCAELKTVSAMLCAPDVRDKARGIKRFDNAVFYFNENIKRKKLNLKNLDLLRAAVDESVRAIEQMDRVAVGDSAKELSAMCRGLVKLMEAKG